MLLVFKSSHIDWKLSRGFNFFKKDELPALELGAVAKVHVLCKGVVLPSSGVNNRLLTPNSTGAVEGEESTGTITGGLLKLKVAVQKKGLNAC